MTKNEDIELDDKNKVVMQLLHYFITAKGYVPILLQGVQNEIWLENFEEDYKIVRIVSDYIHNNEQLTFDVFKAKRISKKIKNKMFAFKMPIFSIYTDLGINVSLNETDSMKCISVTTEKELMRNEVLKEKFPDFNKKMILSDDDISLFAKVTTDINEHNKKDEEKYSDVFKVKKPIVTYALIIINVLLYIIPLLTGTYEKILDNFCTYGPLIRSGEYYRLLTGAFFHGGIMHLLMNCYALYVIGTQLEGFMGKTKYIIIYLVSALTGNLLSIVFSGNTASIGASGAIFGLMGSLLYFGYHYRVYLGNVIRSQIIPLVVLNLLFGFMMQGIDNFAHIGGLIGGTLVTWAVGIKYKSDTASKINGTIMTLIFLAFLIYMAFIYVA
ncbi:MAG: rhomboid family intramembrane serine protease [Bacilli bacterium]